MSYGDGTGNSQELLSQLEQASDTNCLKHIYASAAHPTAMFPELSQQPGDGSGLNLDTNQPPAWRQRVSDEFVVRKQSPRSVANHRNRVKKKTGVQVAVRLPSLPFKRTSEGDVPPTKGPPSNSSKRKKKQQKKEEVKITYELEPPDPLTLYKVEGSEHLAIELFDSEEMDRTPEEWVELGQTKYKGEGTPARALFFHKGWSWTPCRVVAYTREENEPIGNYTIEFTNPADGKSFLKEAKRLSLLFADEDETAFRVRVEKCQAMRDDALALRRYTSYVKMQDDTLFAPIQQSALHGIVERLMRNARQLVKFNHSSVESLLVDVRNEYGDSMKQAIVDYKRRDGVEAAKMASLNLPAPVVPVPAPKFALVKMAPAEQSVPKIISFIASAHYTRNSGSTSVVLALFNSWSIVKQNRFLKTGDLKLPMTLFEYQDVQEAQFDFVREKLALEWRALGVNLIRDNLSNVFALFVNNKDEYNESDLKSFLDMVKYMLRQQVSEMIVESLNLFRDKFQKYAHPVGAREETATVIAEADAQALAVLKAQPADMTPEQQMEAQRKASVEDDKHALAAASEKISIEDSHSLLNGYLGRTRLLLDIDEGRANASEFIDPLFVFQMSTNNRQVVFQPELQSVEATMMRLLNVPSKLHTIAQIEHEVVPLLGVTEQPLCSSSTIPRVYNVTRDTQSEIKRIIRNNLRQPLSLQSLYAEYAGRLDFETDEYVKAWFPSAEELGAQRKAEEEEAKLKAAEAAEEEEEEEVEYDEDAEYGEEVEEEKKAPIGEDDELHSLEETTAEIAKFLRYADEIQGLSPTDVTFRLIKVECKAVKEHLVMKARDIANKLQKGLCEAVRAKADTMDADFNTILTRLRAVSKTVKELAELQTFSAEVEEMKIPRLKRDIKRMLQRLAVLYSFHYDVPEGDQKLSWQLQTYPLEVTDAWNCTKDQIAIDNQQFQQELGEEQNEFHQHLQEYSLKIATFREFGTGSAAPLSDSLVETYATEVETLQEKLDEAGKQVISFNDRDVLFGGVAMEYSKLDELRVKIDPYFKLWSSAQMFNNSFREWMEGDFNDLNAATITTQVTDWQKLMIRLEKEFNSEGAEKASNVAGEMREKIREMSKHVDVIEALRSPGLRARHWIQISNLLCPGTQLDPKDLTLTMILKCKTEKYKTDLQDIALSASKEYGLEQSMDKMIGEWKTWDMELKPHKLSGTHILAGSEDLLTQLDDHIMKTQGMRGSPYIKPLVKRCSKWEEKLQLMQKIMESWLECQKTWIYLEPIFGSEDIMRQMPKEGSRFKMVDIQWRSVMESAGKNLNALEFMTDTEKLLSRFQKCNEQLDLIGKGLSAYLETKQIAFPRFYFLSNDELLSILSQTKNALAVQPHLNKCFDALKSLNFSETQIIQGMYSAEGEYVPFHKTVNPNEGPKKGNVELWLKETEMVIFECMKRVTRNAIGTYSQIPRETWILQEAGQVVLSVSQLYFTREVTEALATGGTKGLKKYLVGPMKTNLERLVQLVRGKLTKLERRTLKALCVVDVHGRTVIEKMVDMKVSDADDFEWLAQLRYYWEAEGEHAPGLGPTGLELAVNPETEPDDEGFIVGDGLLNVRIVNAYQKYGYEYLGNSDRLVITPLTDRCYRTLMGAVHLHLGGAPEGPAGTGKTETVKDLSKALAIQCIVFNCSDGLNFRAMAKMFKGLAASGSWACFDEFNRIELEVLSVVAQQIGTIQRNIVEGNTSFFFDNVHLPLVHTCSAFITMNPGYAGRAELPDNLKALFRTVAMMIPDYALIAEIVLYSFGYEDASTLSRKTVSSLSLSSEQLSSQHHYDFGMRTLFSILSAAGTLKLAYPDKSEAALCLRAVRDCNVPKFVSADLPLFAGILQDLFPGVEAVESDRTVLLDAMKDAAISCNLQPTPPFIQKVVELFDTFCVRHGLMIVGEAFAGKSANLRVLAKAVTSLKGQEGDAPFHDVKPHFLNPKSINIDQLYGADDPNTKEWKDGVLGVTMRQCINLPHENWKWVVFDGPVDAIWIENMNTVLDNNKKLCLASGEQIKLVNLHTMVFEVEDLSVASPATVSRCGMVFMEPSQLGWRPLFDSWLHTLTTEKKFSKVTKADIENITTNVDWLVPPSLEFLRRNCKAVIPTSNIQQVVALCKLFGCILSALLKKDSIKGNMPDQIENMLLFCMVWSLGCTTDFDGRVAFSMFLMELMQGETEGKRGIVEEYKDKKAKNPPPVPAPKEGISTKLVFDFLWDTEKNNWVSWMETRPAYKIRDGTEFHEMIVPSLETISASWVAETLIRGKVHILLAGDTGTGKSVIVTQKLLVDLKKSPYIPMMLSFSARTSANQTQDIVDGKLDRRRLGVFGPPVGRKAIVFVDDLNMPSKEEYGAQPPIELLRQFLDYSGWFDRLTNSWKSLVDIQLMAAMGPPGGGRNPVTYRMTRHFHTICLTPYSNNSLVSIFSTILSHFLAEFSGKVSSLKKNMVIATTDLYTAVVKKLLPTPAKSHYTFNLRDVSKVFQGITTAHKDSITEAVDMMRLWIHESSRVFADRLVNEEDLVTFNELVNKIMKDQFGSTSKDTIGEDEDGKILPLIFTNFGDPKSIKKPYVQCEDVEALNEVVYSYLKDYNNIEKTKMNLVMFTAAIEHISRISRCINTTFGNALLVGVGGSGRQSLSRLASFISDMDVFQIKITKNYGQVEWRENIKDVMRQAGCKSKPVMFLFTDSQIKSESFVEDINNLLNNGEVPNLFPQDEKMPIIEEVRMDARKAGQSESNNAVFAFFINRCRQNLHMVLCMSPIGDAFRNRLRMFPALVNCCTIDWFHPWPTDALKNVATRFLKQVDLEEDIKVGVVNVCVDMQERVKHITKEYYDVMRRYNYVTPTSYLELIKIFINLFEAKRSEISNAQDRYKNGLEKIAETKVQVIDMQAKLVEMQPKLIQSSKDTEELIIVVTAASEKANAKAAIVAVEEAESMKQAEEANAIKADCDAGLAAAIPALNGAIAALSVVTKGQIDELKGMKVPTAGVLLVAEALCIIMGVAPMKKGEVGKKVDDYWEPAKKQLFADKDLMKNVKEFKKDEISAKAMNKIRANYVGNPAFTPLMVAKASKAAEGFCKWITAMETYDRVSKEIAPKRAALAQATKDLEAAQAQLAIKKAELKEVTDNLAALNAQLDEAKHKKKMLEEEVETCSKRLVSAEQLIGGLSGEKGRWQTKAEKLGQDLENVVGNILISSGVIAYLGVFVSTYRARCVDDWVHVLQGQGITCDDAFKLNTVLGDLVTIREWGIQALPNDDFSIDNAIILTKSLRWGLLIDPQMQANRWIKNMEDEKEQLKVLKQTDDKFMQVLIMSVSVGLPVLVEAVGESLEPSLEPLLLKNTFKVSGHDQIILGGETTEYSSDFRLYLTTKLSNPHYPPEASTKVTLINFMVTVEGLEDQMLNRTVAAEHPALEQERNELIVKNAENQKQLQMIEDRILQGLRDSKGNILDDVELIATLAKSKEASKLIEKRVVAAAKTQADIDQTRTDYKSLAYMISILFFCISDLAVVDPMYQYSLEWFVILYLKAIKDAEETEDVSKRTENIRETFMYSLYSNVCRSLFEKDKLFFAFHVCVRVLQARNQLDASELRFLLTGAAGKVGREIPPNPCDDFEFGEHKQEVDESLGGKWLTQKAWEEVSNLGQVPAFEGFETHFKSNQEKWRGYYEAADPVSMHLPSPWEKQLSVFQKLCVCRALRPDKMVGAVRACVAANIGEKYTQPPPFDLPSAFADATSTAPLIFVLSSGVDPTQHVFKMGNEMGYSGDRLFSISLGQGQGPFAEAAIREAIDKGTWVLLQNCHLLVSWLPTLQKLVEELDPATTNPDFRLWLTSMPSPHFPVPILQNGIKMTNEPPKGIKANIANTYRSLDDEWFEDCSKPDRLRKMFYALAMFHGVCLERRKFGPMGWNIQYQWTVGDREISKTQLKIYLDLYDQIPVAALRYLFGALNYGGRVTDEWDSRAVETILTDYVNQDLVEPGFRFDLQGKYTIPLDGTDIAGYKEWIQNLPEEDSCEVFGLHDNVNISAAISDTTALFDTLLFVQPRTNSGAGGMSRDDVVGELAKDLRAKIPDNFDIEDAEEKYPVMYENSMNTVLVQELSRFNNLVNVVRKSLEDVQKALKGEVVLSVELEAMANSMYNGKVPNMWHAVAYPSLKPLSSWVIDLLARLDMFRTWIEKGAPCNYWVSGFFFTQSFLTGTLQNYARKYTIAIDQIQFSFEVVPYIQPDHNEPPEDGCYIHGLFLDGARFKDGFIAEPMKRQLNSIMPTVWLKPMKESELPKDRNEYPCPIYKTSERFGVLSTTGRSTNFVIAVKIPSREPAKHWIKRGVALLCQKELA